MCLKILQSLAGHGFVTIQSAKKVGARCVPFFFSFVAVLLALSSDREIPKGGAADRGYVAKALDRAKARR